MLHFVGYAEGGGALYRDGVTDEEHLLPEHVGQIVDWTPRIESVPVSSPTRVGAVASLPQSGSPQASALQAARAPSGRAFSSVRRGSGTYGEPESLLELGAAQRIAPITTATAESPAFQPQSSAEPWWAHYGEKEGGYYATTPTPGSAFESEAFGTPQEQMGEASAPDFSDVSDASSYAPEISTDEAPAPLPRGRGRRGASRTRTAGQFFVGDVTQSGVMPWDVGAVQQQQQQQQQKQQQHQQRLAQRRQAAKASAAAAQAAGRGARQRRQAAPDDGGPAYDDQGAYDQGGYDDPTGYDEQGDQGGYDDQGSYYAAGPAPAGLGAAIGGVIGGIGGTFFGSPEIGAPLGAALGGAIQGGVEAATSGGQPPGVSVSVSASRGASGGGGAKTYFQGSQRVRISGGYAADGLFEPGPGEASAMANLVAMSNSLLRKYRPGTAWAAGRGRGGAQAQAAVSGEHDLPRYAHLEDLGEQDRVDFVAGGPVAKDFGPYTEATIDTILKGLHGAGLTVAGDNPYSVDANQHGIVLGAVYHASGLLTVSIVSSNFYVSHDQVWSKIDPMMPAPDR